MDIKKKLSSTYQRPLGVADGVEIPANGSVTVSAAVAEAPIVAEYIRRGMVSIVDVVPPVAPKPVVTPVAKAAVQSEDTAESVSKATPRVKAKKQSSPEG